MQKITLIFLFTINLTVFGQLINKKDVYGKWTVQRIIDKPKNPQFKPLIKGFENSNFFFSENGSFELTTSSKSPLFEMITNMTKGTKWKLLQNKPFIKIGNKKDRYSIMGISITEINGVKIFYLDESGIKLEMKKVE
ncbi:hypothetical protein [Tenacibaculum sp. nBUS_03]|uniref:hypothetical protein n=1 Tax=Tenacibaculum sp. nBUS_03 TaxID=3395320 RepID=UPI003EBDF282